jgi:hypothetical protein
MVGNSSVTLYEQVKQTKASTLQVAERHFNPPMDAIKGTVKSASGYGVEFAEFPGRTFRFCSDWTRRFSGGGREIGMVSGAGIGHDNWNAPQRIPRSQVDGHSPQRRHRRNRCRRPVFTTGPQSISGQFLASTAASASDARPLGRQNGCQRQHSRGQSANISPEEL